MEITELRSDYKRKLESNPDIRKKIKTIETLEWIESSYYMEEKVLNEDESHHIKLEDVWKIINEDYVATCSVEDHIMIKNYYVMIEYIYGILRMEDKTDLKLIEKVNRILSRNEFLEEKPVNYRKTTPVVTEFTLVPPHYQTIVEELMKVISKYNTSWKELDPILRGCYLHNAIIWIYPFAEHNEATARAILNYELLSGGYAPIAFNMDTEKYHKSVKMHINSNSPKPFYDMVCDALVDRYVSMLEIFEV